MITARFRRPVSILCYGLFLASLATIALLFLPVPLDFPPLLFLEFGPRWLFVLGMFPLLLWVRSNAARSLLAITIAVSLASAVDFQTAGCNSGAHTTDLYLTTYNVGGGFVVPAELMLLYQNDGMDALLLQEVNQPGIWKDAAASFGLEMLCEGKLCIVTHHMAVARKKIERTPPDGWGVMAALFDVCIDQVCIPLANIHLTTPRHEIEAILDLEPLHTVLRLGKLRIQESDAVSRLTEDPWAIALGDFNMTEQSPIYRRYWSAWTNAFGTAGCGMGHTKYTRRLAARIDHILVGYQWRVIEAHVREGYGGDHRPLSARLSWR
ncbi:MAG: endonuclease/exonuclease/phosphatase family protein [Pseudomonadota bacterium]